MTKIPGLLAGTLLAAACSTVEPPSAPAPAPGPDEAAITTESLVSHLRTLASDEFEGRGPATPGGMKAAEYLAAQLAALGLEPAGDGGTFFQQVPIIESVADRRFVLSVPGTTYGYLTDVVAFAGVDRPRVQVQGDVVFVGHGIVAPELGWNDYAGVDVKGKWVLVMVNDPPATAEEPDLFGGRALTYYGRWTYKFEEAARQGAAGALLIHTDESATYPWQVVQTSWSGPQFSLPPAAGAATVGIKAWLTESAARDLVARGGRNLDALREMARRRGFKAVPLDIRAAGTLAQKTSRTTSPNVIARLPGTSASEAIVFTAHWDHFGMREPEPGQAPDADRIYNGAYDNASGCAGLLEIAKALVRAPQPPARSMVFVFTTAEESGLLGAEYFAQHPTMPLAQMAANINVDGINYLGPTRDMILLGSDRSSLGPMAAALLAERGRTLGVDGHPERGYFFRSDHFPLAKGGVPALSISEPKEFLGPNGAELLEKQERYNSTDYHQPSDEYDPSWDFSGAVEDMKLLAQLAWRIAAQEQMPVYNPGDQFRNPREK